jgi:hypothetical protein
MLRFRGLCLRSTLSAVGPPRVAAVAPQTDAAGAAGTSSATAFCAASWLLWLVPSVSAEAAAAAPAAPLSSTGFASPEMVTMLHETFAKLNNYGIPSATLFVGGVLWVARTLGRIEANVAANKEISAVAVAAAEAKAASAAAAAEAKIAANKDAAASAAAATEAKVAANKDVIAELAKSVSLAAELAALKAVRSKPALVA